MKFTLTFLLGLTLCLSVVGAEKKTDVERDGYKGPVKSVKSSRENLLHKNDHGWGLLRVEKRLLGFENKNVHEAIKYDEKGNFLIKHPLGWRSNPPSPPPNNPITNEPSPIKKPIIGKDIFKYDEKGNLVEWAWPSVNGKITSKNIYKYDVEGNRIKETSYKLRSGSGEQLVPMNEETWEFTYWD